MSGIDNQPAGTREDMAARRLRAFELRKAGASYRDIAGQLGVSATTIHEDVRAVLTELAEQTLANAAEYRALELERLDMAQFALFQHLDSGDPQIVNAWLKVSESRRRLLGLDAQPGAVLPGNMEITLRWHDDNRRIIDITPTADDHAAVAPSLPAAGGTAPSAVSYRVRWSEMGQEPISGDVEPEDGA